MRFGISCILWLFVLRVIQPFALGEDEFQGDVFPEETMPTETEALFLTPHERMSLEYRLMDGELTKRDLALLAHGKRFEPEIEQISARNHEAGENIRWCAWLDEIRYFTPECGWASMGEPGSNFSQNK